MTGCGFCGIYYLGNGFSIHWLTSYHLHQHINIYFAWSRACWCPDKEKNISGVCHTFSVINMYLTHHIHNWMQAMYIIGGLLILMHQYGHHSCPWWRHQMETFSALLALCAGNSPVSGEFPAQRPVTRSFDVFFDLRLNKRLSKQSRGWWFETLSRPLWRHYNAIMALRLFKLQGIIWTNAVLLWIRPLRTTRRAIRIEI